MLGYLLSIYNLFIKTINFAIYFLHSEPILRNYSLWRSFWIIIKVIFKRKPYTYIHFHQNEKFQIFQSGHNFLISLIPWNEKFVCIFHQNQCSWFFRNACKKKKKLHKILLPFFNQSINQFPFHFKTFDKIVSFFPRTFCAEERRNITKIIIDQSHAIHVFHAFSASADYCRG